MDRVVQLLADHYGTTPRGLLEGLVALEYSLLLQELPGAPRPPTDEELAARHWRHRYVLTFARAQESTFTTRMVHRATGLTVGEIHAELLSVGWPRLVREGVAQEIWLPVKSCA
jgi:hypothetical protein